ncbi:hypothetical protein BDY19DRAFT_903205 [Irpex rosettiformis]|uniref:Uncharacterized protein n=1 Tax=Irpex rosettiformis TaxID=378272 RepID=A0ACB8UGQ9_9APHY|nr:hypothetical protein BDY19DRAFT_903205 [Irpex rosettiformis]
MYFFSIITIITFFFFIDLVAGSSIRIRSPYCCQNKIQTRSLPENSPIRRKTPSSASWTWVGTECTLIPPQWVDPAFECDSNMMYCTNTLQDSCRMYTSTMIAMKREEIHSSVGTTSVPDLHYRQSMVCAGSGLGNLTLPEQQRHLNIVMTQGLQLCAFLRQGLELRVIPQIVFEASSISLSRSKREREPVHLISDCESINLLSAGNFLVMIWNSGADLERRLSSPVRFALTSSVEKWNSLRLRL